MLHSLSLLLGVMIMAGSCTGCSFLKGIRPDSPVEEFLEEVVAEETGLDLDLSPSTPEG